jgi:hypothetical protein
MTVPVTSNAQLSSQDTKDTGAAHHGHRRARSCIKAHPAKSALLVILR